MGDSTGYMQTKRFSHEYESQVIHEGIGDENGISAGIYLIETRSPRNRVRLPARVAGDVCSASDLD